MKNKAVIISIIVVLLIAGAGVFYFLTKDKSSTDTTAKNSTSNTASSSQEAKTDKEPAKPKTLTADDVVSKLQDGGVQLGEKDTPYYQMVGAVDGVQYGVGEANTTGIEIYQFDDTTKLEVAKEQLKSDDSTLVVDSNVLVLIHSVDTTVVSKIKGTL